MVAAAILRYSLTLSHSHTLAHSLLALFYPSACARCLPRPRITSQRFCQEAAACRVDCIPDRNCLAAYSISLIMAAEGWSRVSAWRWPAHTPHPLSQSMSRSTSNDHCFYGRLTAHTAICAVVGGSDTRRAIRKTITDRQTSRRVQSSRVESCVIIEPTACVRPTECARHCPQQDARRNGHWRHWLPAGVCY